MWGQYFEKLVLRAASRCRSQSVAADCVCCTGSNVGGQAKLFGWLCVSDYRAVNKGRELLTMVSCEGCTKNGVE